ncbi:divalent cation tolerance protein CutA [Nonomuraea sp. NN258]|uniref:divalent cation tolerance protein CutA n=1 Tax=Nonomuraea antri TaxID=2730852 RepID=UPI0015680BAF|nr:divalent cation tolerance protein CutA [Nonomuraea antri]NRQ33051.1 divalent cation tolerance protein CutA [Nonomuraea antri]
MTDCVQIVTTVRTQEDAYELAHALTGARLASSVDVLGPVVSIRYRDGVVKETRHWLLTMESVAARLPAIEEYLSVHQGHDVPHMEVTPIPDDARVARWTARLLGPPN